MFPVDIAAPHSGADLGSYIRDNRAGLDATLLQSGAIRFRGFEVHSPEAFQQAVRAYSDQLLDYTYRSTPRKQEIANVYTSTEYPAKEEIPLHNENSYTRSWPRRLWFYCHQPAAAGGATPIADSRRVAQRVPPPVRERFAALGVLYVRNYNKGIDLPWQEVFQTDDRQTVDAFCQRAGIEHEWERDRLRTRQVCQGVATHPGTGDLVWFNQAHVFHPSALPEETREALSALLGANGLTRNAFYGDGTPISEGDLSSIREAYRCETVDVVWERGDVLLVDNMLVAHGRRSYTPPRKVLVAMTDPMSAA